MEPTAAFSWRKLDHPGHDSRRLFKLPDGWNLLGAAVFFGGRRPCHFHYEVATDAMWRTRRARVTGYLGNKALDLRISASKKGWKVDGKQVKSVAGCIDLDLGFTPDTNLIAIRRLSLKVGERAEAPAAYLQFPEMRMVKLPQIYHRIGRTEYKYEAPTIGYTGKLTISVTGAVIDYPGLFERVVSG